MWALVTAPAASGAKAQGKVMLFGTAESHALIQTSKNLGERISEPYTRVRLCDYVRSAMLLPRGGQRTDRKSLVLALGDLQVQS
jgi:hypothetical protein